MNFLLLSVGLIPSLIWLSFFLQEDVHPEPRKMIFYVFLGGVFAAVFAFWFEKMAGEYFTSVGIVSGMLPYIAAFAAIEEVIKFFAAYLIIRKSPYFDEPIDAMIYTMTAAMGLAAVENVGVMFDPGLVSIKIGSLMFRFLGATLLHALSSSALGYYWARGMAKRRIWLYLPWGIIMAILLHTTFNYFIVVFDGGILYSIGILIFAAFFVLYDFEKLKKNDTMNI